jgi:hypothetical protein
VRASFLDPVIERIANKIPHPNEYMLTHARMRLIAALRHSGLVPLLTRIVDPNEERHPNHKLGEVQRASAFGR